MFVVVTVVVARTALEVWRAKQDLAGIEGELQFWKERSLSMEKKLETAVEERNEAMDELLEVWRRVDHLKMIIKKAGEPQGEQLKLF